MEVEVTVIAGSLLGSGAPVDDSIELVAIVLDFVEVVVLIVVLVVVIVVVISVV